MNFRVLLGETGDGISNQCRQAEGRAYAQTSCFKILYILDALHAIVCISHRLTGVWQKVTTCFRQEHQLADTLKELHAQFRLQLFDLL